EGMLLHVEDNVEIAWRAAIGAGFAFAGDAEARAGVHAGRNAQFDDFFALDAALPAAIGAALFDDLASALASGASAGAGEESLLIRERAAAAAGLAGNDASSLFCAGAVAGFAVFLAWKFNFRGDAGGGFFKGKRHVVAQIGAALRALAPAAATAARENVVETE